MSTGTDFSMFQGRTFERETRSGRKFVLRELSAADIVDAAAIIPEGANPSIEMYLRVAIAVVSIDGHPIPKGSGKGLAFTRLNMLSGNELDELTLAYIAEINTRADVPKDSPPAAE